ncbi:MAG: response regulator [Candidatus Methylacidiphilales bacterium]
MDADSSSLHRSTIISEGEAISLLAHEMSNTLMVIQSRLDSMRGRFGNEPGFQEIQSVCNKSSTVMRGALALLGQQTSNKRLIALAEHLESRIGDLVQSAHHGLGLRTHNECRIYTSPQILNLILVQVVSHFHANTPKPELYVEVYSCEYEGGKYGVLNFSGPGELSRDSSVWSMLDALVQLQGGRLVIEKGTSPRVCLMFPLFQKRDSLYALRTQNEMSSALIVEDNVDVAEAVAITLRALGIPAVEIFHQPQDALAWLERHTPGLVITDYSMMGMNGVEFLQEAQGALASSTVVIMSGLPGDSFKEQLAELSIPVQVLMKPLKGDDMLHVVMQSMSGPGTSPTTDLASMKQTIRIPPQRPGA